MTRTTAKPDRPERERRDGDPPRRPVSLQLAEWTTMSLSALLILSVATFLVREALQDDGPHLPVDVRPLVDQSRPTPDGRRYLLPVEVENLGRRTMHKFKGQLSFHPPASNVPQTIDFELDYLAERSTQQLYFFLDHDPRTLTLTAKPIEYQLN